MSNSLRPHESQHARPPYPSPTPGVHSHSRPSSQWCHPAISSFVVPFCSCPQSLPASESFSNESTLRMRWPKYWSFSFSIIPYKEIPGLISFRVDWLDLLAVQGTLKSLLQHHSSKASILRRSAFFTRDFLCLSGELDPLFFLFHILVFLGLHLILVKTFVSAPWKTEDTFLRIYFSKNVFILCLYLSGLFCFSGLEFSFRSMFSPEFWEHCSTAAVENREAPLTAAPPCLCSVISPACCLITLHGLLFVTAVLHFTLTCMSVASWSLKIPIKFLRGYF